MKYTAIVDYGVGNLKSVANAMAYIGQDTLVTGDPAELERADAIILPGVGAFPDAADKLRQTGLAEAVLKQAGRKPILGMIFRTCSDIICQILGSLYPNDRVKRHDRCLGINAD